MISRKSATLFAGAGFSRAVSEKVRGKNSDELMPLATEMFSNKSSKDYLSQQGFADGWYYRLGCYLKTRYGNRFEKVSYEVVYSDLLQTDPILASKLNELVFEQYGINFPPIKDTEMANETIKIIREYLKKHDVKNILTTNLDILLQVAVIGSTAFEKVDLEKFAGKKMDLQLISTTGTKEIYTEEPIIVNRIENDPFRNGIQKCIPMHGSILLAKENTSGKFFWQDEFKWKVDGTTAAYTYGGLFERTVIPPVTGKRLTEEPYHSLYETGEEVLGNTNKLVFYGFGFSEPDISTNYWLKKHTHSIAAVIVFDKRTDSVFQQTVKKILNRKKGIEFFGTDKGI